MLQSSLFDQLENDPASCAADSPAKIYPWLESVAAWLANDQDCSFTSFASLVSSLPSGWSSKTSLACYPHGVLLTPRRVRFQWDDDGSETKQVISPSSCPRWLNSGMAWPGGCLILNTSEWPKDASVSSLSDTLESVLDGHFSTPADLLAYLAKYYLNPKACSGIIRRAAARNRTLPEQLMRALEFVAAQESTPVES